MRSPTLPPGTHGANPRDSGTNKHTQRQWKDIKHKYLEGAEEEE